VTECRVQASAKRKDTHVCGRFSVYGCSPRCASAFLRFPVFRQDDSGETGPESRGEDWRWPGEGGFLLLASK
jgi:hypothetical protein